jgi:perosamine synthetase
VARELLVPDAPVPFFRPDIRDAEIRAVAEVLRSGWLTTGKIAARFEAEFAEAVGARHAVAVNSCTAALHLALDALGLSEGQAVLVPTLTFAATAEVVQYLRAVPVLVDCDPQTLQMDFDDAARRLETIQARTLLPPGIAGIPAVGMIPVHVGGCMIDVDAARRLAERHALWTVEDAAHAFPAAWRRGTGQPWQRCGENTAAVSCFSFYANKTITTGEGGMAVTDSPDLAARMRLMSLHGLSHDAWDRYTGKGTWDYRITAPGYKYNLTDIAAALGLQQLARAEAMRRQRERIANRYCEAFSDLDEIAVPFRDHDRIHAWHLFPIRLRLNRLTIARDEFVRELDRRGIRCSVHWRPLHLHPHYQSTYGWRPEHCPAATATWQRLVSLPLFSAMGEAEVDRVIAAIRDVCGRHAKRPAAA